VQPAVLVESERWFARCSEPVRPWLVGGVATLASALCLFCVLAQAKKRLDAPKRARTCATHPMASTSENVLDLWKAKSDSRPRSSCSFMAGVLDRR